MSILRITLGSLRFLGQPAKAAAGATPGDPVTSSRITCTPAVDGAAVMAAGVHTVTPEVITASAITDITPWTYDLVDPTDATPTGWGWTITIAPAGGGEPLVASLTAATIAALPATGGVRTARLEDWIQTGTPDSQPGAVVTTVRIDASTQPGQALVLDGTGAVVVGVDKTTLKGDPGDLMPVSTATWSGAVSLTPTGPATIRATLTGNFTLTLGAGSAGVSYTVTLDLRQDNVGSRLLTIKNAGTSYAVPIALQIAANSRDIVHLLWTGADWVALLGAPAVGIPTSWIVS